MAQGRILDVRIRDFLYSKLGENFRESPNKTILINAAKACVGEVYEVGGDNSGPLVEACQSTINGASREAWCLSFIQTLISFVEHEKQVSCDLGATEHCLTLFSLARKNGRVVEAPMPGDIMLWNYDGTTNGHAELVVKPGDQFIETVGGNTGPGQGVIREGDGVYAKLRSLNGSGSMRVLGFIRPTFIRS